MKSQEYYSLSVDQLPKAIFVILFILYLVFLVIISLVSLTTEKSEPETIGLSFTFNKLTSALIVLFFITVVLYKLCVCTRH